MPDTRTAGPPTPLRPAATVSDVVYLLKRYASADRELAEAMDRIGAEVSSSRRVSYATVSRLLRLLDQSLMPGVRAKAELNALPSGLRRAGIAAWARQTTTRVISHTIGNSA
jgi:hypothetical protein